MVRLVFRPYTQLRQSICTSELLRSSIRVSPDFNLARHSSPSFGFQRLCSAYSQQCEVDWKSRDCALRRPDCFVWNPHMIVREDRLRDNSQFKANIPKKIITTVAHFHTHLRFYLPLGVCHKCSAVYPAKALRAGEINSNPPMCLTQLSHLQTSGRKLVNHTAQWSWEVWFANIEISPILRHFYKCTYIRTSDFGPQKEADTI